MMRRLGIWLAIALGVALLGVGGYRALELRRLRAELAEAERDMTTGHVGSAWHRLRALAARWPDQGEVQYRLGVCERARGRFDAALAAWARVPPGSPFAARAAALRGEELINSGRYAAAEAVLSAALPRAGDERYDIERALARLYRFEGRVADVRHLLRASWPRSPDPAGVLKEIWLLDYSPMPVEAWGVALDHADADDDRVWLGRAGQATQTGRFDEAARWLDACLRRRPDDPAIWRARLDLAVASDDPAGAWRALPHLPADALSPAEGLALRAWLVARRGDREAERRALVRLVERDPGNSAALERLAALAVEAGRPREAEPYYRRKAEVDRAKDRFRKILLADGYAARAGELARLAEALGRRFEARAWALLDARRPGDRGPLPAPADPDADPDPSLAGRTLADRFADLGPGAAPAGPTHAVGRAPTRPDFVDEAEAVGLKFVFDNGQSALRQLPETMSGGVAVLDYDGDGWLDVYCVQGGPLADDAPREGDRLFRNNGDGTFRDATAAAGLASLSRGYGLGVAVGDVDNDGRPDLFVTRLRSYALYRNRGDGTFEDATARAGLAGVRDYPSSAAFADLDGDGDLDLYACHYMVYDPDHPVVCQDGRGEPFYCDPSKVVAAPDHLFRNDGGRFVDVTARAGIVDRDGRGLGVVAADLDGDGKLDLYVANDGTANFLFRNRGGLRFEEVGLAAGVAAGAEGGFQASMGVACGDQDGDGRPDLAVTNFYGESSTLYRNLGGGLFADHTAPSGLGLATRYLLGFGTAFLDYDDDGHLDLVTANGHVNDNRPFYPYAMPAQLLAGGPDGRLTDVSARAGPPWDVPRVGRGLATADLDNDGRLDVLILSQNEPLAYLRNRTAGGHRLTLRLEGTASNRDAVGAVVTVVADGRRRTCWRFGGGSYQSAGDPRLHVGLGPSARAESVEVRWPSGRVDRFGGLAADAGYLLREGDAAPRPLPGFRAPDGAAAR
jgi:enediyne biosynthesis protein E4